MIIGKLGSVPMGCNTDWRLKDLTMTVLLEAVEHDDRKKTGKLYSSLESMTWMANFVRTMLEDTTSFVRAGALDLLAKLSSIYPYVIDQHIAGTPGKQRLSYSIFKYMPTRYLSFFSVNLQSMNILAQVD